MTRDWRISRLYGETCNCDAAVRRKRHEAERPLMPSRSFVGGYVV